MKKLLEINLRHVPWTWLILLLISVTVEAQTNDDSNNPSRDRRYHVKVTLTDGQKVKGVLKLIGDNRIQLLERKTIGKMRTGVNEVPDTLHYSNIQTIKIRNIGAAIGGFVGGIVIGVIIGGVLGYLAPNDEKYDYDDDLRILTGFLVCGRIGGFDKGDYDPACSPNGEFIAFSSYTDPPATAQWITTKIAATSTQPTDVANNFSLEQNRPNPFTNETKISFKVALVTHVTLTVYNLSGQKIKTLADANYEAGSYTISWNGKDNAENTLPAGIYLCQMQAGSFIQTKKMTLIQ